MAKKPTTDAAAPETSTMAEYRMKTDVAMSRIKDLERFRSEDEMVDYVFKAGHEIFQTELDKMEPNKLIQIGGNLTAIYAYLGNKAAYARAQRDVYTQKRDELMSQIATDLYADSESKITLAKAKAKLRVSEIDELVTIMEHEKTNYENLLRATDKMVSFIQSALRMITQDMFRGREMYDSGK